MFRNCEDMSLDDSPEYPGDEEFQLPDDMALSESEDDVFPEEIKCQTTHGV